MKSNIIKRTKSDVVFDTINYFVLCIALFLVLYPLYFILIASFSSPDAVNSGKVLFVPKGISFDGYARIFQDSRIWLGYRNTVIYTVIGTIISVTLTMMIAYPLSVKNFSGRKFLIVFLLITMYFNGGLIPTYLVVKSLNLVDSWAVMVLLGAVSVYNVIIARTFLQSSIPEELYEAAVLDGCSHFVYFSKILLPLSKALIAVLTLYYGIAQWNEFMKALIYLNSEDLYPLQLILRSILIQNQNSDQMMADVRSVMEQQRAAEMIKYGVVIVASVPVLVLYPFLQKYFVKGVMIGSVKG